MSLAPGVRLGPYTIVSLLGAGGMGQVYRARDERLARDVAIKVLAASQADVPNLAARLQQEAQTTGLLNHPNIVAVFDIGTDNGVLYVVTELLEGRTLRQVIDAHPGGLPPAEAAGLARQIASGLAAAHDRGVVHRDIKPENIFLTADGRIKVLDFGLALRPKFDPLSSATLMPTAFATSPGSLLGTVGYMSPEQVRGQAADSRSDIFSLGAVLYELLAGTPAFRGPSAVETLAAILQDEPAALKESGSPIAPKLARIVRRCLATDPGERYQSARDLSFAFDEATAQPDRTASTAATRRFALSAAALAIAVLAVVAWKVGWLTSRESERPAGVVDSIAVLPLANLSGDPGQEFFADGMTDALITGLSKVGAFRRVISRTSAMTYKGSRRALPEIARSLGVDVIVEGSVVRAGDRVRIAVQLFRASTEQPLWAETYDRDLRDVLTLESELTSAIAQQISITLSPQDRDRLARSGVVNPAAHLAYLQGRYHLGRPGRQEIDAAIAAFNDAIEHDPRSALAYAGLADAYQALRSTYLPPHEVMPRAKAAAMKAVELDGRLAEAHNSLGNVRLYYEWDWAEAGREFRRAIDVNPGLATPHSSYAVVLAASGKGDESASESRRALELDPLSLPVLNDVAWAHYLSRRYADAIDVSTRAVALAPGAFLAYTTLGLAYEKTGRLADAVKVLEEARRHDDSPTTLEMLGGAYAAAGREQDAEKVLIELTEQSTEHYVCPYEIATVYAGLKRDSDALEWLERGYRDHADCMPWIATDAKFDALHDNQQFRDLVSRVGFRK